MGNINGNLIETKEDFYKMRKRKEARRKAWVRKERKKNKIYFIICMIVIIGSGISMLNTNHDIKIQEEQLRNIHIEIAEQAEANEEIEQTLTLPREQLLEQYARENYDYLRPDEIKFYWIGGTQVDD